MDTLPPAQKSVRTWCMLCHLSALAGLLVPGGNVLGPLIVWLMKKDEGAEVDEHGKASLNFQISVFIYVAVLSVLAVILMFVVIGFLLIPVIALLCLADVVLVI